MLPTPSRILLALALTFLGGCSAPAEAPDGEPRATIYRDAWGAPHVLADTDEGAVFGMGWALADDDWPLIEGNYLNALGRSAEQRGEAGLADDWMARALDIVDLSKAEYAAAPPRIQHLLDAFTDGINAWLEEHPQGGIGRLESVEPWYPLALIRFKYYQNEFLGYAGLRGRWTDRLLAEGLAGSPAFIGEGITRTAASVPFYEGQFGPLGRRPRGSNQWAVAPSRTAAGQALLLINPHQSFVGVQRYAEVHVDSEEGLRFSGLTVFGFALPYMGHNDRLGWAYTDNYADHSDLWSLDLDDPANPLAYRYDGAHRPIEERSDTLRVRVGSALEVRPVRLWRSHHGPVVGIDDEGRPLAVGLARIDEGGWLEQWEAMIRARDVDAWKAAASRLNVAYMNAMYADADGNIGYVYGSAVPVRAPGVDPGGILEGSDPATEWQGFHTFEELPQVWNPASGWLMNTNSTPFTATVDLPFDRSDFPAYMVGDETDNARAVSSRRILTEMTDATFESFAAAVWDSRLSVADDVVPLVKAAWDGGAARGRGGPQLAEAVERLVAWDRVADTLSVETTWLLLAGELRNAAEGLDALEAPGATWLAALDETLRMLEDEWGTIEVPWGRVNRHQRPLPGAALSLDPSRESLAIGGAPGGLGSVFSYYSAPGLSAGPRLGRAGNSFVKVVEFGPTPRAASILNYGQSGNPDSPHFFDQAPLYAARTFKPAWFTRADVIANAITHREVR